VVTGRGEVRRSRNLLAPLLDKFMRRQA
jgi:hypothetical protein